MDENPERLASVDRLTPRIAESSFLPRDAAAAGEGARGDLVAQRSTMR